MRRPLPRSLLRVAVLVSAAALPLTYLATAAMAQDAAGWLMAGGDPAHSGTREGPRPPYSVTWEQPTGAGGPASGVAVSDDVVVVVTREGVVALDPARGDVIWERERSSGPAGVPAIAGDLILYARGSGESAQLVARELETGDLAWEASLGSAAAGGPTVEGDTVVVGTGGGEVVALDLGTGEESWSFETAGAVTGAPAIADDVVVAAAYRAGTATTTVYGLDLSEGGEDGSLWRLSPGAVGPASSPAVAAGRAFVGLSDLSYRAVSLDEGNELWTARTRDGFGPRQVPAAGEALILADRTHLYRLDPGTGEELWVFRLADLTTIGARVNTLLASSPAVSAGAALIGAADGTLSAIDVASGRRVWRTGLSGPVGPVAVSAERIYAVTMGDEGAVVALEHDPDGRLLNEVSPTVLFVGGALLNFAAAAAAVGAAIILVFRFALRPRPSS